jgi:hypothetical protein
VEEYALQDIVSALQVPLHYIVIRRLSIGSLLVDFNIVQNESTRISLSGVNQLLASAPVNGLRFVYGDVTGSTEPIVVMSSSTIDDTAAGSSACNSSCLIGIVAAASIVAIIMATSCILWKLGCHRRCWKSASEVAERHEPKSQQSPPQAQPPTSRYIHDEPFDPLPGIIMPPQSLAFGPTRTSSSDDAETHHRIHVVASGSPASPSKASEHASFKLYRTGYKHVPPTESSVVTADLLDWDMIESLRGVSADPTMISTARDGIETPVKQHQHHNDGRLVRPSAFRLREDREDDAFEHVVGRRSQRSGSRVGSPRHAAVTIFPEESVGGRSDSTSSSLWEWEFAELPEDAVVPVAAANRDQAEPPLEVTAAKGQLQMTGRSHVQAMRPVPPTTRARSPVFAATTASPSQRGQTLRNPFAELEEEEAS